MAPRSIVHIEIPSADREKTDRFYSSLFDWSFEHMGEPYNYSMFRAGNTGGGLIPLAQAKPGELYIYVESDDIEADLARITAAGGKVVEGKSDIPDMGSYALFEDPTGNKLALWQELKRE